MTTKGVVFAGACGTADTEAQLGSSHTFSGADSRIIGLLVGYGDEGVQEPHDSYIELKFNNIKGYFQYVATSGGATASAATFALCAATFIPLDIEVGNGDKVDVYATSSGTPESVHVTILYE